MKIFSNLIRLLITFLSFPSNLRKEKLTDNQLIDYVIRFPKLLERPILLTDNKGLIARPPEKVLEIL